MRPTIVFFSLLLLSCSTNEEVTPTTDDPEINDQAKEALYFPSNNSEEWESISVDSLGWNSDALEGLDAFVTSSNTRALLILKNGKIAYEHYGGLDLNGTGSFTKDNYWYWASAAKTLTSFLVGQAEAQGLLSLDDPSSTYLGSGWTSMETELENAITIRHQLTMTTGLDYTVPNPDCTDVACLQYLDAPENRWFYHNAPYTMLEQVLEGATMDTFNNWFNTQLRDKIGMEGFWEYSGYNQLFLSPPRSMARFGLLVLAEGKWNGEEVLDNDTFYKAMTSTSQTLNPSYGYLWWLNGKGSLIRPGGTTEFQTDLTPNAPEDLIAAMGKNGQLINVVPSQQLVVIRMGDSTDDSLVPFTIQEDLWDVLNTLIPE